MSEREALNRPCLVIQVSTSVDGRMALGPNRTWWDDLDDPRCKALDKRATMSCGARLGATSSASKSVETRHSND